MTAKATTESFIEKANLKHRNTFDYSLVDYVNSFTKIQIVCPEHGEFMQTPNSHLSGSGCPECVKRASREQKAKTLDKVIRGFRAVHKDKYSYEKVEYVNTQTKVEIVCRDHGSFLQVPNSHLRGRGCKRCSHKGITERQVKTLDDFITDAKRTHDNLYKYANTIYTGSYEKVLITCAKHGDFLQRPNDHLMGAGCPSCAHQVSKQEKDLADYIESLGFAIQRNTRKLFTGTHKGKEADIFIPSKNVIIEFDGLYWHSTAKHKNKYNLRDKTVAANEHGYKCIHVMSDQWAEKKGIVKSLLASQLGVFAHRVGARQTDKRDVSILEYKTLTNQNHLKGFRAAINRKGLYYQNELVAAIGYDAKGELIRYVVKNGWQVMGALSKLIKGEAITFSYCDLTFFDGKGYAKAGFTLSSITKPGYRYVKGTRSVSRESMMKHKLKDKFDNFDATLTEVQNCNTNGWYQLFDCGNAKYILS